MVAVVELADVQAWLEATKYSLAKINEELEETARHLVYGKLSRLYDTSTWTTSEDTPELVRRIIGMLVAAWEYDRATAEDQLEGSSYADKLERRAMAMLQAILDGDLEIPGVDKDPDLSESESILFFPTDLQDEDDDHARVFTIGKVF